MAKLTVEFTGIKIHRNTGKVACQFNVLSADTEHVSGSLLSNYVFDGVGQANMGGHRAASTVNETGEFPDLTKQF